MQSYMLQFKHITSKLHSELKENLSNLVRLCPKKASIEEEAAQGRGEDSGIESKVVLVSAIDQKTLAASVPVP